MPFSLPKNMLDKAGNKKAWSYAGYGCEIWGRGGVKKNNLEMERE